MSRWYAFGLVVVAALVGSASLFLRQSWGSTASYSAQDELAEDVEPEVESAYARKVRELAGWKRPEGPFRVALQAGHWKAAEAPDEFPHLADNTGTSGGGTTEWETNLDIARRVQKLLEAEGVLVEILPATVPPEYWADLFIAIHADGNANPSVSGYKAAAPRRDMTGRAAAFVAVLEEEYQKATGLAYDPNVTRNMTGYYAFNWRRYEHALHPMTTGVILETGFLTSPGDRRVIVRAPDKSAAGIAAAVLRYRAEQGL
jgi:hypothetical protein